MERTFIVDERPKGGYVIKVNKSFYTVGSYNVLCARTLNISYPDYLRLCRDEYGARIIGKNTMYPFAIFPTEGGAQKLSKLLNEVIRGRIK